MKKTLRNAMGIMVLFATSATVVQAQIGTPGGGGGVSDFKSLVLRIVDILSSLSVVVMGLATIYFLFGLVKYLTQYGNEKARAESVKTITYGLIGLFVMVAVWGLVQLLSNSLLGSSGVGIPQFPA